MTASRVEALTSGATGDREALVAFLLERIGRWPWWDSAWRVLTFQKVDSRRIEDIGWSTWRWPWTCPSMT